MGLWTDIEPYLQRKVIWHFADYLETPTQREDGKWYRAFLFRDGERTEFGIKEFLSDNLDPTDFRKLADRVIKSREFRAELLSDDSDLPRMWKKH